jgi:6-pyruvoyl tetrahydropterin synthase/QueD family protein
MGYRVIVDKSNLHFAAGHFITYAGKCEVLHGHNYCLSLDLEGGLTADGFVFDFVALKKIARAVTERLDHRFLLATENPHLRLKHDEVSWEICYKDDRYVLPNRVVLPLPLDNITAERLAEYIWGEVAREIRARGADSVTTLTVGIEEAPGQTAYFSQPLT